MTGRTPAEAVNNYQSRIQRLLSCVSNAVVGVAGGYFPSPLPHSLISDTGRLGGTSRLTVVKKDDFSNQPLLNHLAMTPSQQ